MPTAKAMSVAMGMPHPRAPSPPTLKAAKMSAGRIMPPSAATIGSAAARGSRSSPVTISRLISRPATKKNSAIRPSLTASCRVSSRWNEPTSNANGVDQNVS